MMGTMVNLTIVGDRPAASRSAEAAFAEIMRIESLMSPYRDVSDVYRINHSAGKPVSVSSETLQILDRSIRAGDETGGAFDITFASIAHLWDYKKKTFVPPAESDVHRLLPLVNYRALQIDRNSNTVTLPSSLTMIGLGGIAKGYAVARALQVIREHGIENAIVDAGGDLQVAGTSTGRPWRTGVRHPRDGSVFMAIDLESGEAVTTSGDYERYAEYRGKRYQHIIDPRTGHPADGPASVSVLSKDPVRCDYLATAFMVRGIEWAKTYLHVNRDVLVVIVDGDMKVYVSESLKKRAEFIQSVNVNWIQ